MTTTELDRQAAAVADTKALAEAVKREMGNMVAPHKPHMLKANPRLSRKPSLTIPDYHGLDGDWLAYYKVAQAYVGKVPTQDRDDVRHDIMLELDRATKRDGKPLPELRAYRIASFMVALYYRQLNRFSTRVCVFGGNPTEPRCKGCANKSQDKRCVWLAVRPVERLDGEVIDPDGYKARLLDTVASGSIADMPDKWYDINQLKQSLPLRLVEIGYLKQDGKPLSGKDRKYLCKMLKRFQKPLF